MNTDVSDFQDDEIPLKKIIDDLKQKKDRNKIGNALDELKKCIDSIPSYTSKTLVLNEIMAMMLEKDAIYLGKKLGEKAIEYTDKIDNQREKAKSIAQISTTLSEHGFQKISKKMTERAFEEGKKIRDEEKRVEVLLSVTYDQFKNGFKKLAEDNFNHLLEKARALAKEQGKVLPLAQSAEKAARMRHDKTEEICEEISKFLDNNEVESEKIWVKKCLASAYLLIDNIDKGERLASDLARMNNSSISLYEVISVFSEKGLFDEAIKFSKNIENKELRDSAVQIIIDELVEEEKIDRAVKLYDGMTSGFEKDIASKILAEFFTDKGDLENANNYIDNIDDFQINIRAELSISKINLENGQVKQAEKFAFQALEKENLVDSDAVRLQLVETLVLLNYKKECKDIEGKIENPEEKAMALGSLAAHY